MIGNQILTYSPLYRIDRYIIPVYFNGLYIFDYQQQYAPSAYLKRMSIWMEYSSLAVFSDSNCEFLTIIYGRPPACSSISSFSYTVIFPETGALGSLVKSICVSYFYDLSSVIFHIIPYASVEIDFCLPASTALDACVLLRKKHYTYAIMTKSSDNIYPYLSLYVS